MIDGMSSINGITGSGSFRLVVRSTRAALGSFQRFGMHKC